MLIKLKQTTAAISLCLSIVVTGHAANAQEVSEAPANSAAAQPEIDHLEHSRPTHVLFVGNSYFYYNDSLHNHVQRMAVAAGLFDESELTYKSATIGGAALHDHNIVHLLDPANLRVDRQFDVVILGGGSAAPLSSAGRRHFARTAERFATRIRAAGGEPVLYMTHAYVPPHARYRADMIDDIASLYVETGNQIDALVVPVGLAFAEAYRRRPDMRLHVTFDGSHPNMLGTYLAASTVLASVYGVSPVGNSYTYFGEVTAEDALFLQQVAQDTVTQFYGRDE